MSLAAREEILRQLSAAVESSDPDTVAIALEHARRAGLSRTLVPVLLDLLAQRTHTRHEDIVSALQYLKDERAVDALYAAALVDHDYLAYDESFGLAQKCTWALANIGTAEAQARLEDLARHPNPRIVGYARKRLDLWSREPLRKGVR